MQVTAEQRRVLRHSPWLALIAAAVLVFGLLVPAATAKAAAYSAPPELTAVNSTKNTVELVWRTITGAPAYRVRAVGGGETLYQNTGSDGWTVFKALKPNTAYTFNVAVLQVTDGKLLSAWSKATAKRSTTVESTLEPPTELAMVKSKQAPTTLTFSWVAPAGYDAGVHQVKLDFAEDQAMTTGGGTQYPDLACDTKDGKYTCTGTLTGLASNTNFFVRATVVNKADRAVVSDRTTAALGKTLSPIGWIHGYVSGAPDDALANYVVALYSASTGDVNEQVELTKSGGRWEYKAQVRPGGYYVQIVNVGSTNYTSLWAKTGENGAVVKTSATQVGVAMSATTEAPEVKVGKGGTLTGQITCPGQGTKDSCSVDVTAMAGKDVIAADRSDKNGVYTITGLPAGEYTVRTNHAEDRFVAHNDTVTVVAGDSVTYNHTMAKRSFLTTYKVRYSKKGRVLKWSSRAYLAAVLPTERADNNDFQWYRNGSPIPGATGSSLRSSGGKIKLCVRFGRFGFYTADWSCSASHPG